MKSRSHRQPLFAIFAVVALLFAACGDDDDGSADSAGTTGDVSDEAAESDDFDFVLDVRQDGFQLQATTGTFGDEVSFHDIEDFENPRQAWRSEDATIEQDGDAVTAQAQFVDETDENAAVSGETVAGTLEATCG